MKTATFRIKDCVRDICALHVAQAISPDEYPAAPLVHPSTMIDGAYSVGLNHNHYPLVKRILSLTTFEPPGPRILFEVYSEVTK